MNHLIINVIHVKGNREREAYIVNELSKVPFKYEFVLDGNIEDLSRERLAEFFDGPLLVPSPASSCAFKHFLAYEKLSREGSLLLIMEDDIELFPGFYRMFTKSLEEIKQSMSNFLVNYELSLTLFVNRSEQKPDKVLYKKERAKCTGLYLIDAEAARNILQYARENKCSVPIDIFHDELVRKGIINMYWSHPSIGQQMSHNGKVKSLIDNKASGGKRQLIYKLKMAYRKIRQFFS